MRSLRVLSRRAREQLSALQSSVHQFGADRSAALRNFVLSRAATTAITQRDYWFEFALADQEYWVAVRRLSQFCLEHSPGVARRISPGSQQRTRYR